MNALYRRASNLAYLWRGRRSMDKYEKAAKAIFAHPFFLQSVDREQGAIESAKMWAQMPDDRIEAMLSRLTLNENWWQWCFEHELAHELYKKGMRFPDTLSQRQTTSQFIKKPNRSSGKHDTRNARIAFAVACLVKSFPELSATRNDASKIKSACDVVARVEGLGFDTVKKAWLKAKGEAMYTSSRVGNDFIPIYFP